MFVVVLLMLFLFVFLACCLFGVVFCFFVFFGGLGFFVDVFGVFVFWCCLFVVFLVLRKNLLKFETFKPRCGRTLAWPGTAPSTTTSATCTPRRAKSGPRPSSSTTRE